MIKQLIKIGQQEELGNDVNTVNARDLHEYLESGQDFSTWIKNRISEYDFQENQDFILIHKIMEQDCNKHGGSNKIEYHISLDMAKELAMVERNAKGRKMRKYLIELQKRTEKILTAIEHIDFTGNINDLVFYKDGKGITTSRVVAHKFEKQHKNILQIIDTLFNNNIDNYKINKFNELNFKLVNYLDEKNELRKAYEMTEEGFSLVALSLTGQKALEFKIDFINAFSAIKEALFKRIKAEQIRNVLPETESKRQYVYIIGNEDNSYIKIGVSADVEKRLKQLQTGSWTNLFLIYKSMVCSNAFDIEKNIHNKISSEKVRGEWFEIEVSEAIKLIESENHKLDNEFLETYYETDNVIRFKKAS
jgi:Rha family phage regulatory protein